MAGIFDKCGGTDNVFAYNWVHDNAKDGINLGNACDEPARRQTAHHNVTSRSGNAGILVAGSSSSPNYDARCIRKRSSRPATASLWRLI